MAIAYNRTRLPIQLRNLTKFRSSAHFYDTEEKKINYYMKWMSF